jgi:vacuolar-type H+-ATPase subunit H
VRAVEDARLRAIDIVADARHEAERIRMESEVLLAEARAERDAADDVAARTVARARLMAQLIVSSARSEARLIVEDANPADDDSMDEDAPEPIDSIAGIADEPEGGEDAVDPA